MWTRLTWIVAILALVAIGFLMACSTKYSRSSSTNALVVVPSQGSAVMQSFSVNLANGEASQINNVNGPPTPGLPTAVILDPSGAFAYVIMHQSAALVPSVTGIGVFPIDSDGKLGAGTTTTLNNSVVPVALAMDSAGKFLFVANSGINGAPGSVSVLAVGSNGSLTELPTSPFPLPVEPGGSTPSASALAVTPDDLPSAVFVLLRPHRSHHGESLRDGFGQLRAVELLRGSSAGTLTLMPYSSSLPGIPTGSVPSGVAVDPCNRFVYVANAGPGSNQNTVSAYTICSVINLLSTPPCPNADFSLNPIGSSAILPATFRGL